MDHAFDQFTINDQANIIIDEGEITHEEYEWLRSNGVLSISSHQNNTGKVNSLNLNVEKLAQVAFEHELLDAVASTIEVEIMRAFRKSNDRKLTTQEITNIVGRPKSSVSRALKRLTEKGKISKVQDGVYRS